MEFGEPSKLLYAKRVAAALGYIALSGLDRVGFASLSRGGADVLSPKRGKGNAFQVFGWLGNLGGDGATDLAASLREFSLRTGTPGIAIVISDFFDPDYQKGVMSLLSRHFEVTLVHVLDDEELKPTIVGDLKLVDSEDDSEREVSVTPAVLKRYERAAAEFCEGIETFAHRYGVNYIRTTVSTDFEDLILTYLRRRGMLR
jgi:uncharacterized protein (DUF58 family)